MSPRPYQLGRRQESADETRKRILAAARELLGSDEGFADFTMEAIARKANVARMTVYYQFESKGKLLEAVTDYLGTRGGMQQLAQAFRQAKALDALDHVIDVFAHFWAGDRLVLRRLRALAALDPEFEQAVRAVDERRRQVSTTLVSRIAAEYGLPVPAEEAAALLIVLLGFETFDGLAGPTRSPVEVVPQVRRLIFLALGLDAR